ncbi:MAG: phosphorylase [Deltaproteobacteria bacterium]|nr:MAG: phosphorylase [Deltaproteobacteria bacterium]
MTADVLIEPRREKHEKQLPKEGVLFANPSDAEVEIAFLKQQGGESRFLFNSGLCVERRKKFIAGPAVGAPMAAIVLEKLVALGAERIVFFGWCGALDPGLRIGDILVPDTALSGEGTSSYYPLKGGDPAPEAGLRESLVKRLQRLAMPIKTGRIWSTDALYRESRAELFSLRAKKAVVAVDMEFSALCAVAAFRSVALAGALIVSDELWADDWRPGFTQPHFRKIAARVRRLLVQEAFGVFSL